MAVCALIQEVSSSYSLDSHTSERKYNIHGVTSRVAAEAEVAGFTPAFDGEMIRKGWDLEQTSLNTWSATVKYSSVRKPTIDGELIIRGKTGGQQIKITHARKHIGTYVATGQVCGDHKGAINVTSDGIEGLDVGNPGLAFTVVKAFAPGTITMAYIRTLSNATWHTNDAAWHGFAKGELLIEDASWDLTTEKETLTIEFVASPNVTNLVIPEGGASTVTIPSKEGHHYVWFEHRIDEEAGKEIRRLVGAHVEQVYDYFNFALLGI